jgi:hypothetical protein
MSTTTRPLARKTNLFVQDANNELVVYDTNTDKAYVLNPSAAAVWRACNGKRSVQEIAQYLNQTTPTDEQAVYYALRQLNDLLEQPAIAPKEFLGMSRRDFLKRTGLATAAAIPVVVKIVAPTPAHAQSAFTCCECNDNSIDQSLACGIPCDTFCAGHGGTKSCGCIP